MLAKQTIVDALRKFARQRPGLEYGNYGDPVAYRAELRSITKDLAHAQTLLRAIDLRDSITADDLLAGFDAFSGRLTITERVMPGGASFVQLDYCTGQYWPTEYRRAVCAVCASVLWNHWRSESNGADGLPIRSTGDHIRKTARDEFGRGVASRWFN